jgi:hypothetical protein
MPIRVFIGDHPEDVLKEWDIYKKYKTREVAGSIIY